MGMSESDALMDLKQEQKKKRHDSLHTSLPLHCCTKLASNLVTTVKAVVAAIAYAPHDMSSGLC